MSARDAEKLAALKAQVESTQKVSVEEWMERAGVVVYTAAVLNTVEANPADAQEAMNHLLAIMPESMLLVSALYAQEMLGGN